MSWKIDAIVESGKKNDIAVTDRLARILLGLDGGPGSGNWGHRGRPGQVGGSGRGGGSQYRGGRSDIGYFGSRGDWLNGLTGEKQRQATKYVSTLKEGHKDALEKKKKILSAKESGKITEAEAEKRLKAENLQDITENMSPEEFAVRSGDSINSGFLVNFAKEARNWDKNKDRLMDENLSEDEKKLYDAIVDKWDSAKDIFGSQADASLMRDQLEAKAMGLVDFNIEAPDEIQYRLGTKERPAEPKKGPAPEVKKDHMPSFLKPKQTEEFLKSINSIEGRDPEIAELYTRLADLEKMGADGKFEKKVTYSEQGHRFSVWSYAMSGMVAKVELRIPKLTDERYRKAETATTVHELAHLVDFMCRADKTVSGDMTKESGWLGRFGELRRQREETSDEVRNLFNDIEKKCNEAKKAVSEKYKPKLDEVADKISKALAAKDWEEYRRLDRERNRIYKEEDLESDNEEFKVAGGYASLMDIYQALGDSRRKFGHEYRTEKSRLSECWANWCEISMVYPEVRELLEREKPEFCKLMNDMTQNILGRVRNGSENS